MPALLEPPRKKPAALNKISPPSRDDRPWTERLSRSGYFVGAVLFHLVVFLLVATWVVFQAPPPPAQDLPPKAFVIKQPKQRSEPPPTHVSVNAGGAQSDASGFKPIVSPMKSSAFQVSLPNPNSTTGTAAGPALPTVKKGINQLPGRLEGIRFFILQGQNRKPGNFTGDPKDYDGSFSVYLASYADGDWNANVTLQNGAITSGSLPDLIAKMNEWSHGHMKGKVEPTPLAIGGTALRDKKPPFIFFTGHKDFVLTDAEIDNLRIYLHNGGMIWGDNALPGYGSRFDVAFRREMKRVIPDVDKNFEEVPLTHEIFAHGWFPMDRLPGGMNDYSEPLQHLDLDGRMAILYTPNDYSDLFTMRILPGDERAEGWEAVPGSPLFTNSVFGANANVFFRNYTLPSSLAAQHLGMNIIGFLLTRFDKDLILIP